MRTFQQFFYQIITTSNGFCLCRLFVFLLDVFCHRSDVLQHGTLSRKRKITHQARGGGGNRYRDWRDCTARTTWPWPWENIKCDKKLYTLREHIAYYETEKHTWENTDMKNWGKKYTLKEHVSSKVHPDGRHIPVPPPLHEIHITYSYSSARVQSSNLYFQLFLCIILSHNNTFT